MGKKTDDVSWIIICFLFSICLVRETKIKTQRRSQVIYQLRFSHLKVEIIWPQGAQTKAEEIFWSKLFAGLHGKKWKVCDVCERVMVLLEHMLASQFMMRWINNEYVV